jgi:hypothetical protein
MRDQLHVGQQWIVFSHMGNRAEWGADHRYDACEPHSGAGDHVQHHSHPDDHHRIDQVLDDPDDDTDAGPYHCWPQPSSRDDCALWDGRADRRIATHSIGGFMQYTVAGLTFTFTQDSSGLVTAIQTPNIPVGPFVLPGYVLNLSPGVTVAAAEQIADGIVGMLGLG